ncbi:hypothetical protein K4K57_008970 [Colletotrichum sp. SAR 10_99]|nr:hypothetical protein K4K55_004705 [Colletotrichum sp. SAR 10_96]KAI8252650.1 hypothetical protein K4K56_008884 [Colletotrichum sp. SAR 10_98]KAJ5009348.1 hypothetical protein K4K57_008970 [Colletotrichum sp. SAR 10_99]
MTTSTILPRFLLPALSPMWRAGAVRATGGPAPAAFRGNAVWNVRYASTGAAKGPIVLEKPEKFNPPSHGSRLPKKGLPKHYGGQLSSQEVRAQRVKEYPGMPAPEGTWAHWFVNNKAIHLFITMGTLTTLAVTSLYLNFTHTSPFKHLLPPASEFWSHPVDFVQTWIRVLQLHERDRNEKAIAMHTRHTDDVAKRQYYRKEHGLDKQNPIANFLGMKEGADEPAPVADAPPVSGAVETTPAEGEPRKKWFGIF